MVIEAMGERFASSEAQPDDQAFERCVEIRLESTGSARQQLIPPGAGEGLSGLRLTPRLFLPGTDHEHSDRRFQKPARERERRPAADRLIAGNPRQQVANYFSDATQQFHSGIWSSTRGKWRIRYSESEFCCLTRGRVALERRGRWTLGICAGEGFVVPGGFAGTWEVIEDCTKFYAIFEART